MRRVLIRRGGLRLHFSSPTLLRPWPGGQLCGLDDRELALLGDDYCYLALHCFEYQFDGRDCTEQTLNYTSISCLDRLVCVDDMVNLNALLGDLGFATRNSHCNLYDKDGSDCCEFLGCNGVCQDQYSSYLGEASAVLQPLSVRLWTAGNCQPCAHKMTRMFAWTISSTRCSASATPR